MGYDGGSPPHAEDRTEVIGPVSDVDDSVECRLVTSKEGLKLFA